MHKSFKTFRLKQSGFRHSQRAGPTLPSLFIQSLVSLALQGDKSEVDTLPLQKFIVFSPLYGPAVLKAHNHISVLYGGQTMSNRDSCAAQSYL